MVVWDGMRPDFVSANNTPVLWKMAQECVFFQKHHAVYPGATNVNGTAIATGVYPQRSGVLGNREYRLDIDARNAIASEDPAAVRKGDELTGGKYLAVPTIEERVQRSGRATAIAGATHVAVLHDRSTSRDTATAQTDVNLFRKAAAGAPGGTPPFKRSGAAAGKWWRAPLSG